MFEDTGRGIGCGGVENTAPAHITPARTEAERDRLVMGVEENGKGFPDDALAVLVRFGDLIAGQRHAEAAASAAFQSASDISVPSGLSQ